MARGVAWDPWQAVTTAHPGWEITICGCLPHDEMGCTEWDSMRIRLAVGLTQAERRSTLAHEIVHVERGPFPAWMAAREERIVSLEAARRLIPLRALIDALRWSTDPRELADQLWVDAATVKVRLEQLTDSECTQIRDALAEGQQIAS